MDICLQKAEYEKCGCILAAVEHARVSFDHHLQLKNLSPTDLTRLEVLKHVSRQDGKGALEVLLKKFWLQEYLPSQSLPPQEQEARTETLQRVAQLLVTLVQEKKETPYAMEKMVRSVLAALFALNTVRGKIECKGCATCHWDNLHSKSVSNPVCGLKQWL